MTCIMNLFIPPTANTTRRKTKDMNRGRIKLCNRNKCENSLKSQSTRRKHPISQNTISCSDRFLLKWRRTIRHIFIPRFERLAYQACAYRSCRGAQVSLWAEDNEMSEERNNGNLPEREGQHFWGREDCGYNVEGPDSSKHPHQQNQQRQLRFLAAPYFLSKMIVH